uniref:Uncharacterized protein n=1 Tax=Amphimedon queenslandica TaxID=400682 RepID=A0A1X7TY85_AMPQE
LIKINSNFIYNTRPCVQIRILS